MQNIVKQLFIGLGILAFSAVSLGDQGDKDSRLSCALQRPFIMGASISAGYKDLGDATAGFTHSLLGGHYLGKNPGPVSRLARIYNSEAYITNIAEINNTMEHSALAYAQFNNYRQDPMQEQKLRNSTLLASIDGLYWATIYGPAGDCSWTDHAIHGTRDMIGYAQQHNIPIVLGNVPNEDPSKVSAVVKAAWNPPKLKCLKKVNQFLQNECHIAKQCYVIDLYRIVENLKGTIGPHDDYGIWFGGESHSYNDFRKDGVHMWQDAPWFSSEEHIPVGMKYLMKQIEDYLNWGLPQCHQ